MCVCVDVSMYALTIPLETESSYNGGRISVVAGYQWWQDISHPSQTSGGRMLVILV